MTLARRNSRPDNKRRGLTSLAVSGYKSISEEQRIDIRPLTLLSGANSSGKSSIVQPLLLLKQTLDANFDPGPLLIDGPHVRFTAVDQMLSRAPGKHSPDDLEFELGLDGSSSLRLVFTPEAREGVRLKSMAIQTGDRLTIVTPEMPSKEISAMLQLRYGRRSFGRLKMSVSRRRSFLTVRGTDSDGDTYLLDIPEPVVAYEQAIRSLIHVPGLRGNPERTYRTSAVGAQFPGTFETYVASVIHRWQRTNDERIKKLNQSVVKLGLTWKVSARRVDDTQVELQVGRLPRGAQGGARDLVNIADVGFGMSQTLPVVVALLAAAPGQLVYIEQPEIHLHPRAQSAMAELLAQAASRGVRVLVETHSALLLLAVQTLVAEGTLDADDVALHWFERTKEGSTEVTSASLDSSGAFGDWPEDFATEILNAEDRYLEAAGSAVSSGA